MIFIQIAIALAICLLLSGGSMLTAKSEMMALQSSQLLSFYTQDVPSVNLAIQKLVASAESFNVFMDEASAESNTLGNVVTTGGAAVRLNFLPKPSTPSTYPVGILYTNNYNGNPALCYSTGTASTMGGSITGINNTWVVVGTLNKTTVPFTASFGISDSSDSTSTAAGLLVTTLTMGNRLVTLYAERF